MARESLGDSTRKRPRSPSTRESSPAVTSELGVSKRGRPSGQKTGLFPASSLRRAQINALTPAQPLLHVPSDRFSFPLPPPTTQPLTALICGTGDMGQFGLGVDKLEEIVRPQYHQWVEEGIVAKSLGGGMGLANVEAGGMHTLVASADGMVYSWGINDNAALGRKTVIPNVEAETLETQPLPVQDLEVADFYAVTIAAGDSISLALSEKGEVRAWGSFRANEGLLGFDLEHRDDKDIRQFYPSKIPNVERYPVVSVACGSDHVLALTSDGTVFLFGNGEQQQLGRKIISRRKENGLSAEPVGLKKIQVIGAGSYHSFAVDVKGRVYSWGLNSFRQTGVSDAAGGNTDTVISPTIVDALDPSRHNGARVVAISGGEHHSLFLLSNGELWGCGRCDGFEIGLPSDHPEMQASQMRKKDAKAKQEVRRKEEEAKILAGDTSGLKNMTTAENIDYENVSGAEAAVLAAEAAAFGAPVPNDFVPEPTKIAFPVDPETNQESKIIQVAAGTRHNLAVSSTGNVYAWGLNGENQLGLGSDTFEQETPAQVKSKDLKTCKVLKVSTGGQHSLFLAYKTS